LASGDADEETLVQPDGRPSAGGVQFLINDLPPKHLSTDGLEPISSVPPLAEN
jgi:hypothetical protein